MNSKTHFTSCHLSVVKYFSATHLLSFATALVGALLVLTTTSCKTLDWPGGGDDKKDEKPYFLRFYKPVEKNHYSGRLHKELYSRDKKRAVTVRSVPLLTSRCFQDITKTEKVEKEGLQAINIKLDKKGVHRWRTLCSTRSGRYVAVAVDGIYQFLWRVPERSRANHRQITVRGPWDTEITQKIIQNAEENYKDFGN